MPISFVSAVLSSLCSFLFIYRSYPVNHCTPEQTENLSEIYDLFSLPLVLFYSLPHGNNTTRSAMHCIISPSHPSLLSAYKETSSLDPGSLFTQSKLQKSKLTVNYEYAITFVCEPCLSSAPCSQMVLGRLSYCELPRLIDKHVLVNHAYPKWQLLSRHYNELPEPQ